VPLLRETARREHLFERVRAGGAARECYEGRRRPLARACPLGARATHRVADAAARLIGERTTRCGAARSAPTACGSARTAPTAARGRAIATDNRRIADRKDDGSVGDSRRNSGYG